MSTTRRLFIWIAGLILVLLILIVSIFWGVSKIPPLVEQFPQNTTPISITIISPANESEWPADSSIPIQVITASELIVSELEFWVGSQLVSTVQNNDNNNPYFSHTFFWLPRTEGKSRIFIRAKTTSGQNSNSNLINLNITEPVGMRFISPPEAADVVEEIILPVSTIQLSERPGENQPPPKNPVPNFSTPISNDFSLWLGQQFTDAATPPAAPVLSYTTDGCSVNLTITDQADTEFGFFIYRSSPGSIAFERIASLGKVEQGSIFGYTDPDQIGEFIYYVSSFNGSGEAASNPVQIKSSDTSCSKTGKSAKVLSETDQNQLNVFDLAYFYYSLNGGGYQRYPQDPKVFLTPAEYSTPILPLVKGLTESSSYPVSYADLVIWGWEGGSLVNLGSYHLNIDSSRLTVCNLGTGCTGDAASGFLSSYGEIANDDEVQQREFYWSTNAPGTTDILWQISTAPFPNGFNPHPFGLVGAGCAKGTLGGSFIIDFSALDEYSPGLSSCDGFSMPWLQHSSLYLSEGLFLSTEISYYLRFIPMAGNQPSGTPSNTVEVLAKPGESYLEPVIVDHLPDIYDVEVLSFTPIKGMDTTYWGCVHIQNLDYDAIWAYFRNSLPVGSHSDTTVIALVTQIYNDLNHAMANNLIVCPSSYQEPDSSILHEWGSMLVDGLGDLWDTVVGAFNALKTDLVNFAATALNDLGIPCDTNCKEGLMTGLEIGIMYFSGIPPTLPEFEGIKKIGIEYAIELAAAEAGIPCSAQCQQILREGLEQVVNSVVQNSSQPGCVGASWAKVFGKSPLCLPPGVETKPVEAGLFKPASTTIQVTRTGQGDPGQYKYGDKTAYAVSVKFPTENTQLYNKTIPYVYSYIDWNDRIQKTFSVSAHLFNVKNNVFMNQFIPVPPLDPGESITIPISLSPDPFYFPEHIHSLNLELSTRNLEVGAVWGIGGNRGPMFDWGCLYKGGLIKIQTEMMCLSVPEGLIGTTGPDEGSILVPCGNSSDTYTHQETSAPCYP